MTLSPRRSLIPAVATLVVASALIFFRLDRADLQTDGATYAVRALGYVDYLGTKLQTTPLQWFDRLPWWSRLSFHDAPPLGFLLQHLSLRTAGEGTMGARLPGAIAGVFSVLLVAVIARNLWGSTAGWAAGLIAAVSTPMTWAAREPYLEGPLIATALLNLWLLLVAMRKPRWWPAWGATLALALLTKYTAIFLVPAALGLVLIQRRGVLRNRRFWLGCTLAIALLLPLVAYNAMLYRTRGHLDLQLSKLAPSTWAAAAADWPKLYADAGQPKDYPGYAASTVRYLAGMVSWPTFVLLLGGLGWLAVEALRQPRRTAALAVLLGIVVQAAFFTLNGPAPRFLTLLLPLLIISAGGFAAALMRLTSRIPWIPSVVVLAGMAVLAVEVGYNFNTNLAFRPPALPLWYSPSLRLHGGGFQQLAEYLQPKLQSQAGYRRHPVTRRADLLADFSHAAGQDVFVYQGELRWFSAFWYFQRHAIYRNVYILSDRDLAEAAQAQGQALRMLEFFQQSGVRRLYYIVGASPMVFESGYAAGQPTLAAQIEPLIRENLARGAPGELAVVRNALGEEAFRVWKLSLNESAQ